MEVNAEFVKDDGLQFRTKTLLHSVGNVATDINELAD